MNCLIFNGSLTAPLVISFIPALAFKMGKKASETRELMNEWKSEDGRRKSSEKTYLFHPLLGER